MAESRTSMGAEQNEENGNDTQFGNSPKRQKLIAENLEKDRISALPDSILLHILALLRSTRYAIRTGTLSKRWQYLWTSVPVLIFDENEFIFADNGKELDFASSVDRTLVHCRHNQLKRFELRVDCYSNDQSQTNLWIRYAVGCNVEELVIIIYDSLGDYVYELPEFLFKNSYFKKLTVKYCSWEPIGEINWKNLTSLCIGSEWVTQTLIRNIESGCPVLETLELEDCYGFGRLDITSTSLRELVIDGYDYGEEGDPRKVVKIRAPNILSLNIKGSLSLWKFMLLDMSSLVEANLDYSKYGYCDGTRDEAEEEMLKRCIQSLQHVKELKIGIRCSEVLSRLQAEGFTIPSNLKSSSVTSFLPEEGDLAEAMANGETTDSVETSTSSRSDAVDIAIPSETDAVDILMPSPNDSLDTTMPSRTDAVDPVMLRQTDAVETAMTSQTETLDTATSGQTDVNIVMLKQTDIDTAILMPSNGGLDAAMPSRTDVVDTAVLKQTDAVDAAMSQTDAVGTAMLGQTDVNIVMLEQTDTDTAIPGLTDVTIPSTSCNMDWPMPDTCVPCPETIELWHGHIVSDAYMELLLAVERQYPETFGRLRVRVERVWETYLGEFGRVITSFFKTSIPDLTKDMIRVLREDLCDLEMYGFDVTWAFEHLHKVEELRFGEPSQLEPSKSGDNLLSLDNQIARVGEEISHAYNKPPVLVKEQDEKATEEATKLGVEYDHLLAGSLGFGLLEGYQVP